MVFFVFEQMGHGVAYRAVLQYPVTAYTRIGAVNCWQFEYRYLKPYGRAPNSKLIHLKLLSV